MRKSALIAPVAAAAAMLLCAPAEAAPRMTGEEQLAKMLEGRVAGKPVDCISVLDSHDMTVIDHTAIVFNAGSVIYVNRPRDASALDSDKILVTKSSTDQLCNVDIVTLRDRTGFTYAGTVGLESFVPYTRVR